MSTIRKLFRISLTVLLTVALLGLEWGTAAAVSSDIVSDDRACSTALRQKGKTIAAATPSLQRAIREKQGENSDTVGWLRVPGTGIDTPILQNPAENNPYPLKNNYYLNRDFYGDPDPDGAFCADYRASLSGGRKSLSRITALYGHSWDDDPDGGLFSPLKRFRDPEFAKEHPYIFFSTANEDMAWEVFAVFDTTIYLPYIRPNLPFSKYDQSLQMVYDLSYYNYDVAVWEQDKLLVLSTCTYSVAGHPALPELNDYRFVVMARLADPKSLWKEQAVFAINDAPLQPDATRTLIHL